MGIAAVLVAHLESSAGDARLFDAPAWLDVLRKAQRRTKRFPSSELDYRGIPDPLRVLHEVVVVSSCSDTNRAVQLLALHLLERLLLGDPDLDMHVHPGMFIDGRTWGIVWLNCISLAAKLHYDVRRREPATDCNLAACMISPPRTPTALRHPAAHPPLPIPSLMCCTCPRRRIASCRTCRGTAT